MTSFNDCVDEIIRVSDGKLTKREAGELLRKFNRLTADQSVETRLNSLNEVLVQAQAEMVSRNEIVEIHAKATALREEMARGNMKSRVLNFLERKKDKSVRRAFDDLFYGSPDNKQGLVQKWEGARARFNVALMAQLQEKDLFGHWQDKGTMDSAIDVVFDPSVQVASKEAQSIGNILRSVQKLSARRLNAAGAYVLDTPRVLFNSKVADPGKVRGMGELGFRSLVKGLELDPKYFAGMDEADIDEYLTNTYERIINGRNYQAITGNFDGIGGLTKDRYKNLAKSNSIDYDIPFASAKAFKEFHAATSDEPLQSVISRRVDQIGRAVGLMEAFGPTPEHTLRRLFKELQDQMDADDLQFLLRVNGDFSPSGPDKPVGKLKQALGLPLKFINRLFHDAHPLHALAYMDGSTAAPVDVTGARIGAGVRSWATMASLGNGVFIQVTDMPIKIAQTIKKGRDPFSAIVSPLTAFGQSLPNKERKLFYTRLGVSADMLRNNLAHQVGTVGYSSRMMSRAMDWYFKLNGMSFVDRVAKQHTADFTSSNLAWAIRNPAEGKNMLDMFRSYGFTSEDFIKLRQTIDSFEGMDIVDPRKLEGMDDQLYEKYLGTMESIITSTTPTPGVREKAITLKGTRPGTWEGEAYRAGMMFKNFPMMLMTKVYPQITYEHGIGGSMATAVSMLFAWYIGDSMKQLANGRTPRDMSKAENLWMAATRSGFGGLYSDILTADYHKYGFDFTTSMLGPVASRANDITSLSAAVVRSPAEGKLPTKQAYRTINRSIPNIHLFSTALDQALMYGILSVGTDDLREDIRNMQKQRDKRLEDLGQERLF